MLTLTTMANTEKSDEGFQSHVMRAPLQASCAIALSLGHELRIFDALQIIGLQGTYQDIAVAAHLKPRYVKEWCCVLACGDMLDYNSDTDVYSTTANRLTAIRKAAIFSTWTTRLMDNYQPLMKAMPADGPNGFIPWERADLDGLMNECRTGWIQHGNDVIDSFVDQSPGLREKLGSGAVVCEAGANTGYFLICMAERFPISTFYGFDISESAITTAKQQAHQHQVTNVHFLQCDIYDLPADWTDRYDYVYVADIIHDLPRPRDAIRCLYRITKPGGCFSLLDFDINSTLSDNKTNPLGSYFYMTSMLNCLSYSLHCGGEGAGTCYGRQALQEDINSAGFVFLEEKLMPSSEIEIHFVAKKPE